MGRKSKKELAAASRAQSVDYGIDQDELEPPETRVMPDDYEEEEEDDEEDGLGGIVGTLGAASRTTASQYVDAMASLGGDFDSVDATPSLDQDQMSAEVEREKMNLLLANFDEDQMSRYEAFRRANINRNAVKKLANSVLNQSVTPNVAVALSGMSKVFVGEIVERAREVQLRMDPPASFEEYQNRGKTPLKPEHLREAWRMFKLESGTAPQAHWRRQGGDGDGMMFR